MRASPRSDVIAAVAIGGDVKRHFDHAATLGSHMTRIVLILGGLGKPATESGLYATDHRHLMRPRRP